MKRRLFATSLALSALVLGTGACGANDEPAEADGPVTITVNGLPPDTETVNRKNFIDDVAKFDGDNIRPSRSTPERARWTRRRSPPSWPAASSRTSSTSTSPTRPALIAKRQVADISKYLDDFPITKELKPELLRVFSATTRAARSTGCRRELLDGPGLQPGPVHQGRSRPGQPAEDLGRGARRRPRRSAALGGGIIGYGDYSKSNTGGWHFTAETLLARRRHRDAATAAPGRRRSTTPPASRSCSSSRTCAGPTTRWARSSSSSGPTCCSMMGCGKLGMYLGTGRQHPNDRQPVQGQVRDVRPRLDPGRQGHARRR